MDEKYKSDPPKYERDMLVEKMVIIHEGLTRELHWDSVGRILRP
jgi:hypothetical protein